MIDSESGIAIQRAPDSKVGWAQQGWDAARAEQLRVGSRAKALAEVRRSYWEHIDKLNTAEFSGIVAGIQQHLGVVSPLRSHIRMIYDSLPLSVFCLGLEVGFESDRGVAAVQAYIESNKEDLKHKLRQH